MPAVLGAVAGGPAVLALRAGHADRRARAALPGLLDHVVAQIRAGGTVSEALHTLSDRPGVLAPDLRRMSARLQLGAPLGDVLRAWADERPVSGVRAAAGALTLVTTVGGSAAGPLEGLAASLRADDAAAGEARALSAQARVSATVVGIAPLGYLAFSTMADPASARRARRHNTWPRLPGARARPGGPGCAVDSRVGAVAMTPVVALVAGGWGALAAVPVLVWSRRRAAAERLRAASPTTQRTRPASPGVGPVGRVVGGVARRRAGQRIDAALEAALPAAFDVLVAAVGAGCAPVGAVELAAHWGPGPIADEFSRRAGRDPTRCLALRRAGSTPRRDPSARTDDRCPRGERGARGTGILDPRAPRRRSPCRGSAPGRERARGCCR